MWVNTPSSRLCSLKKQPCTESLTYAANSSSTYAYVGSYFNISYVDGTGAAGDYVTDTMRFSGANITSFQFGIGYESTSTQNVLGIGYPSNEVQVMRAGLKSYQNLPVKMAAEGLVASSAYSLYLNDLNAETGNVLFGGIDMDRFQGKLVTVPIQKTGSIFTQFFITMTGLDVGSNNVASDMGLAVLLDSGSSLTYLPNDVVSKIYQMVGAAYQEQEGAAFVPCSLRNQNATMTFKFSSPASITVNLNEMILGLTDAAGRQLTFDNNVPACLFGMMPAGDTYSILGDTFLRSAYVVYDMDNNEISLANTKFNITTSNIKEISSKSLVPSATRASNPIAATAGLPTVIGGNSGKTKTNDSAAGGLVPSLAMVLVGIAAGVFF